MSITNFRRLGTLLFVFCVFSAASGDEPKRDPSSVIGRWDITVQGSDGAYPAWLEIQRSGYRTLVGSYVGQFGSARPISKIDFDNGRIQFTIPPQWEKRTEDITFEAKLDGDVLKGETTDEKGKRVMWEAKRAPALKPNPKVDFGEPIELFNGRDLTGWKTRSSKVKNGWIVKDGVLINETPGNDLLTEKPFTDFTLKAEFRYPKGSNSGIYLRGRYEVQIEDNFGQDPDSHKVGGVYGFLTPSANMAKKADEWQTIEIRLVGRQVTVRLNDSRIIDHQMIPGITGGALDSDEGKPGPIMLQGDHGKVEFRKITLLSAK
jgi:hypothetical protein